jgi:hypothetical protein
MKRTLFSLFLILAWPPSSWAGLSVIGNLARTATIKPGDPFEGVILVKNNGQESADARLFQSDYLAHYDARMNTASPARGPRSNASWITVSPSRLKLAAGETQLVRYKGRAPADPKLRARTGA